MGIDHDRAGDGGARASVHRRPAGVGRWALSGALALALVAGACSGSSDEQGAEAGTDGTSADDATGTTTAPAGDLAWPVPDWTTTTAEAAGLDQAALDAMATEAEAGLSNCLVVTRDGEIVDERYWNDWDETSDQEVFSATKSISSTLVGIAQDRGLLDIDDKASEYIPEWVGTASEDVTIRNLVSNDSGRFQDFQSDYVTMTLQEPDKTAYAVGLDQQHPIGTEWVYNNAAIQTLDAVLEAATGMPTHEFARQALFEPLGMDTEIVTDEAGGTLMYMGAQASCRDLARFGLLFLREGQWDGEQVVSAEWVDEATNVSQDLNPNYGFLWWLFGDRAGDFEMAGGDGQPAPGADGGAPLFAALGLGNQVVAVFPDSGVVVTRIGSQKQGADGQPEGPQFGVGNISGGIAAALGEEAVDDADAGGVATGG